MNFLQFTLFFSTLVILASGFRQKLRLYETDMQGDGVILKEKYSDLSTACFSRKTNYLCSSGLWALYAQEGYTLHNNNKIYTSDNNCMPSDNRDAFASVRYLGAADTDTVAMSTYEGEWVTGAEHYYSSVASSAPLYPLKSLALTGWSNWTLYTGTEFNGQAFCLRSTLPTHVVTILNSAYPQNVGSVLRGCDDPSPPHLKTIYVQ